YEMIRLLLLLINKVIAARAFSTIVKLRNHCELNFKFSITEQKNKNKIYLVESSPTANDPIELSYELAKRNV
ncbi:unnamed protein product, partial [Rotaria sp. Silwood1]